MALKKTECYDDMHESFGTTKVRSSIKPLGIRATESVLIALILSLKTLMPANFLICDRTFINEIIILRMSRDF